MGGIIIRRMTPLGGHPDSNSKSNAQKYHQQSYKKENINEFKQKRKIIVN